MLESVIEDRLRQEAKKRGGMALKFISPAPGVNGVPDRIVLVPGGKLAFVELKAPGKIPRALQEKRIGQLRKLGFSVYVLDGTERIGGILDEIQGA